MVLSMRVRLCDRYASSYDVVLWLSSLCSRSVWERYSGFADLYVTKENIFHIDIYLGLFL